MKVNNFSKITINIFGSRITGLIRDILLANYLGANLLADAFLFAFRLPNLFRRIFAEGAVNSVFIPLFVKEEKENIEFIEMPESLRDQYQYYTQANMNKLCDALENFKFHTLEEGVEDYVKQHLSQEDQRLNSRR